MLNRLPVLLAIAALLVGCRGEKPASTLVIGVDGAEWRVIRELWQTGELPNLHGLAERGTTATLQTAYNASPVIWTTIATGVTPSEHGITDFVVPGPNGDVPISSAVRRAPALWSMLSRVHRRVAVIGWWGSWPAEDVDGVVVSDRALLDIDSRVSPPEYLPRLQAAIVRARTSAEFQPRSEAELRDATMAVAAEDLLGEPFDLTLLYFRSADIVSHLAWRENGGPPFVTGGPEVARIYRAIDQAIGRVLKAAGSGRNVLVLSDHGFRAARDTEVRTQSNFDAALRHLGYQVRTATGVDFPRSQMYSYGSPHYLRKKLVRFSARGREPGGAVLESQRDPLLSKLDGDLKRVRYSNGSPVFLLRPAGARERRAGADFVVLLSPEHASTAVQIDGVDVHDVVLEVSRISGTHDSGNDGIFIAAGPSIQPGASLEGIRVHDITPTVLYGLDLPVAENFAGRAWTELYRPGFREQHPLRSIRSWGASRQGVPRASQADEKLLRELRSLGYIR